MPLFFMAVHCRCADTQCLCSQRGRISGQEEAARERSSQLEAWLNQDEAHEQLAVGERVSRSEAELKRSLIGVEKKVDGLKEWWKK